MNTAPDAGPESQRIPTPPSRNQPPDGDTIRFIGGTAWAGTELVNYRQAGRGRPLLLLGAGSDSGTEPHLAAELARRFRVVLPVITLHSGPAELATSLGDTLRRLLDALGFESITIVATPPYAAAALAYSLMDADRVERLVLFVDDRLLTDAPIPLLQDHLSHARTHIAALAWPDHQPLSMRTTAVLEELSAFLD